jgi:hypothetical protein
MTMTNGEFDVPVVLMIFNRPDHTRAVFESIAGLRPRRLFVIADGPRPNRPDDVQKCADSRAILDRVTWDCDLKTNLAPRNIGCDQCIASGLNWVFAQVDRAIILEDDCVPHPTFFRFCAELLERFEDDIRVRTISGNNFLCGKARTDWSYYFSNIHSTWGWATWRRSWERVDMSMRLWPTVRDDGWLMDILGHEKSVRFWATRINRTFEDGYDVWDYQYVLSCWLDHGLAVIPNRNLVSNIGFGPDATHTPYKAQYLGQPREPMPFPLIHPPFMVADRVSDRETYKRRMLPEERLYRAHWSWRVARRMHDFFTRPGRSTSSSKLGQGKLFERHAR